MAINLEAIRKRVLELSGQRRTSSVQLWKPEAGEWRVRGLPWKAAPEGMPFLERRFYYLGDTPRILAPCQFNKPDPINDLIRKLYSTKKPEDRELAKQLQPKMTAYMPVIVRGQEDKGVQVYGFNKFIYQRLLGFFTDAEVGDILDPLEGFDLKVTITPSNKKFNNRVVMDTVIDAARRPSKLHDDPEQIKKWLDSVPNIDDMYQQKSFVEIEQALNTWLAGGADPAGHPEEEGTSRGPSGSKDELDRLADEVRSESKPVVKAAVKTEASAKGKKKPSEPDAGIDLSPLPKTSLDDAFDELMQDKADS